MLTLGVALNEGGRLDRADAVLGETIEAAAAAGERALEHRALLERAFLHNETEPERFTADAPELVARAIPALEDSDDDLGLARAMLVRACHNLYRMRSAEAMPDLERALEHAVAAGAERYQREILGYIGLALQMGPTPSGEAIQQIDRLARSRHGDARRTAELMRFPMLLAMGGDFEEARSLAERQRRLRRSLGLEIHAIGVYGQQLGWVEIMAGEAEAAERALRPTHEALEAMGDRGSLATVAHQLAYALYLQDRLDEASKFAEESQGLSTSLDLEAEMGWRRVKARLAARRGEHAEAQRLAHEAVELGRETDSLSDRADCLMALGEVLQMTEEGEAPAEAIREALTLYEAKENLVSARRARRLLGDRSA
jgi:tetratricopeptide (TPR) repeat protein